MLNIPESIKTLFKTDGVFKNFRVHFPNGEHADLTNADIIAESVKFTESICSKEVFQFGLSERPSIEFECVNVPNIYGVAIECGIEIDVSTLTAAELDAIDAGSYDGVLVRAESSDIGFGFYRIPYGVFVVQSCPRSHGAMYRRRVTGYSKIYGNDELLNSINSELPYKAVVIREGLMNCMLGLDAFQISDKTPYTATIGATFCDANNHLYAIQFPTTSTNLLRTNGGIGDAIIADYTTNFDDYESSGMTIVNALTSAGYDLTYDTKRKKVFTSNEEAIRTKLPFLFHPCVWFYQWGDFSTSPTGVYYSIDTHIDVLQNKKVYIFCASYGGMRGGRGLMGDKYNENDVVYPSYLSFMVGQNTNITIMKYNTPSSTTPTTTYLPVSGLQYDTVINSVQVLAVPSAIGYATKIASTLCVNNSIHASSIDNGDKNIDGYTYANAFSWNDLANGNLELNALFGRYSRMGDFESVSIDQSNPIQISASDYSALWWDDYSIEGVGLITYRFGNSDTVAYSIGNGGSEYDMTNNYLLEHYNSDDTETAITEIQTILDAHFVPKLDDLNYLPSDCTLIGLPYLEAGDYVEISAGSGETVGTYILTRTLTGIQTLEDTFEAKGGEVLGDGS